MPLCLPETGMERRPRPLCDRGWVFGLYASVCRAEALEGARGRGIQCGVGSMPGNSGSNASGVSIEPATPGACDNSTNPIVLVSRVVSGPRTGDVRQSRTENDGPSPLPFIDDPCQLRAPLKVVTGGCGVNASLTFALADVGT